MNKRQLAYVRAVALTMSCIVASLTIFNLLTIATKSISVEIPTEKDISWSIDPQNKEFLFRTAFSVKNHGAYDISNIDVAAKLVKGNDASLISFEKQNMVVLRGSDKTFDILINLDLDTISWYDWLSLIYDDTTLSLVLDIDASYMFGLIDFTVDEVIEIPWKPPVANISENEAVKAGINGLFDILNIARNGSLPTIEQVFSIFSIPEVNYTSESGFAYKFNMSDHSETVKQINCTVKTPLLLMDGTFVSHGSILIGLKDNSPMFEVKEVGIDYVE